jgi:mannose-6-phosphate isomerase class I
MSQEGQRHAEELARLEARKKDLEDALMRLARDEAEALEVAELAQEVEQLENQVETARAAANMEKTMTNDVRKAARLNREAAETQLDTLAKSMQQDGETFEKAYLRALDTDMGKALMQTRDDAQELERGGITSMDVAEAHKNLMEN